MTTLREVIESLEYDRDSYRNPGTYEPESYYVRCDAKADVLDDVISMLQKLEQEQQNG